jgi:undecaprenyl-diphosphatase
MTIFQAFILGIIQGLTEFIPVSSSAHMVLAPFFFGWQIPPEQVFPFDVLVQMGTLIAVVIYFWTDIIQIASSFIQGIISRHPFATPESCLGWFIILATIPAGAVGLLLIDLVEQAFHSPSATAIFLFWTALLLLAAEFFGKRRRDLNQMTWQDALWIGVFQMLSIFPGISRSGSTIAGGMTRDLDRPAAARFSFLMSIPIMLAAGLLSIKEIIFTLPDLKSFLPVLFIGLTTSAIVGFLSIRWLLRFLRQGTLFVFSIYCFILGLVTLITIYAR